MENQKQVEVVEVQETLEQYEAPMLIDLEEFTGCSSHCSTGGSAGAIKEK